MTQNENVSTGLAASRDAQQTTHNHCNLKSLSGQSVSCNKRYSSRATYVCDDVRLKRKDNLDAWTIVGRYAGEMFMSYPFFEFIPGTKGDEEPLRFGDFVIDIDTGELACCVALKITEWFQDVFGVGFDQWRIYLSGKKGVHLELPAEILGIAAGHKLLTLGFKRLAKDIEGELQVSLDTSMYNRGTGKPFRQPNVMREKTGTCKRQITHDELYEITTEEEYRAACNEPGPVWEPEDISQNNSLALKLQHYLGEAEVQQELIRKAPVLTDEEIDRLYITTPPCMTVLNKLTSYAGKTPRTFNDIAIQLTAYAITAKFPENDFLVGCKLFIENYPSSSLDTIAKRYDNCRARYRTMAANGNQHSCGGVLALGIPGFDCESCTAKPAGVISDVAIMTAEDIEQSPLTLNIPDDVLNPGGLISLGMAALSGPGMPDIKQYNLAVIYAILANAIAGKITFSNVWPNVYNIKVGPTSSGKTSSDQVMRRAMNATNCQDFYGPTDFASGPAILRSLVDSPIQMMVIDECTGMFRRYAKADPTSDGKRDALLEIYSASGGELHKVYADAKNSINIKYPCLTLTGNATTTIFDTIQSEDFDTGLMQRFDFFTYDGPIPERGYSKDNVNEELAKFSEGIAAIRATRPADSNMAGYGGDRNFVPAIGITDKGAEVLAAWSKDITARTNSAGSDGEGGIVSRGYHLSIKYAMIHHAAMSPAEALYLPLTEADIEYGKKVARMLCDWKINVLRGRVTTGDFHKDCETFKSARDAAQRNGKRPTFTAMVHKRPQMKNWKRKDTEEIIAVLVKRGEIVLDDSKRPTAYYRPKHSVTA